MRERTSAVVEWNRWDRRIVAGAILGFVAYLTLLDHKAVFAGAIVLGFWPFWLFLKHVRFREGGALYSILIAVFVGYPAVWYLNELRGGFMHAGMVTASVGVAFALAENREWGARLVRTLVVGVALAMTMAILSGGEPGTIVAGSRNHVSTVLLSLLAPALVLARGRWDFLLTLWVWLLCVAAIGSMGILTSSLVLVAVMCRDFLLWRTIGDRAFRYDMLALLLAGLWAPMLISRRAVAEIGTKLVVERFVGGDVRYQILDEYKSENLRGERLVFGIPLDYGFVVRTPQGRHVVRNLHNSYLDAHTKLGLLAAIVFLVLAWRLAWLSRRRLFIAALWGALLLRASSDTVYIMSGAGNFAFYLFLVPRRYLLEMPERVDSRQHRPRE